MKLPRMLWILLLIIPVTGFASERIELSALSGSDLSATVLESSDEQIVVRFDVNAFEKDIINIDGGDYTIFGCEGASMHLNAGEPSLPRLCRSIIIPDDAEMEIEVLDSHYRDYPHTPVAPSKGNLPRTVNPAEVPYTFGDVYKSREWYPTNLAQIREPFILRDYRGTVIEVNAFRYLPTENLLRVYSSVTVAVKVAGPGRVNVLHRFADQFKLDPMFDEIYSRQFLNYHLDEERYVSVLEDGELLIITADSFATAMAPFVSWKIQKGIKTTMVNVSTVGNNSTSIRNYIQNFYTNSSGNLAYVLLVGDAAQIATPTASGGSADPTYAKVAGGDNYPDIFVGRFSAQSIANVNTQVERSVEYERDAVTTNTWYGRATGIASAEGDGIGHNGGEIDYEHMGYIRTDLLAYGYTPVDAIYDPGATAAQVSTALNAGRGLVNYIGHGSSTAWSTTGFSSTNVAALTNDNMLPFIFSVACVNGNFASSTCFAEAWLRSTRSGQPIGALATYMSSINQDWLPPMDAQDEFNDLLCAESKTTYGGLCYNASCRMIELNGTDGVDMFNTWHIFGDPSVQVRTKTPTTMTVSHTSTIAQGTTSFPVTVSGVTGALCALSRLDTLYGSAYTNSSGQVNIPVNGTLPLGLIVKLTVTAFNKVTYAANLTVTASGPSITVVAPNGGENWLVADVDTIKWTSANLSENVKIEIDRAYPSGVWETIVASTANDGAHPWTVTGYATSTARVRISGVTQMTVRDTSNADFSVQQRTITISAPNGGETWVVGDVDTIRWSSLNLTENVRIELMRAYPGGSWETIAASTANDGVHPWIVTSPLTTTARIRITGTVHGIAADTSHADFTIDQRALTVTSPDGGEVWSEGDPREIEWDSDYVTGFVRIELNRSYPGAVWETIEASYENSGSYIWLVTSPTTTAARVRVVSLSYPAIGDTSDANFSIIPPNQSPTLAHDPLHDQTLSSFTVTAIAADDEAGFVVRMRYERCGGAADSVLLLPTANPDEFAATVGPLTAGVYTYDVIVRDIDGAFAATDVSTFEVRHSAGFELGYDDGSAETSHWSENPAYRWAVRFDPPQFPYQLHGARIGISQENPDSDRNPIQVQVLLADGVGGEPGTVVVTKTIGSIGNVIGGIDPETDGWTYAAFADPNGNPLSMTGAFYISVANPSGIDAEAFLHDTSSVYAGHSYVWDPCDSTWYNESNADSSARLGNRLIRAVGTGLGVPLIVAQVEGDYLRLSWPSVQAPVYHIYTSATLDGPLSFIGATSDTVFTVARTDTLGVRGFYEVRAASE